MSPAGGQPPLPAELLRRLEWLSTRRPRKLNEVMELAWDIADDAAVRTAVRRGLIPAGPAGDPQRVAYQRASARLCGERVPIGFTWSSSTPRWHIWWGSFRTSIVGQIPSVAAAWIWSVRYRRRLR